MRITNLMKNQTLVKNLNRHNRQMEETEHQLATGLKLRRPSDEPALSTNQMFFRSRLKELEQFNRNSEEGYTRLNLIDGKLEKAGDIIHRVRNLAIQAANGIYQGDNGFELEFAIKKEVDELLREMVEVANSRDATGRFLFGGVTIEKKPFDGVESQVRSLRGIELENEFVTVRYEGDNKEQLREIEKGTYVPVSIPGSQVFWGTNQNITSNIDNSNYVAQTNQTFKIDGVEIKINAGDGINEVIEKINQAPIDLNANLVAENNISLSSTTPHKVWLEDIDGGSLLQDLGLINPENSEPPNNYATTAIVNGDSIFDVLINFKQNLTTKNQANISGEVLQSIDSSLDNLLKNRSVVGARMNRIEQHIDKIDFDKTYITELLSENEGIDYAETIMNFKWLENVHQYALNVGSKVIRPTLVDFLR